MTEIVEARDVDAFYIYSIEYNGDLLLIDATHDPSEPYDMRRINRNVYVLAMEALATYGSYQLDVKTIQMTNGREAAGHLLGDLVTVMKPRWAGVLFDQGAYQQRKHVACVETGAIYKNAIKAAEALQIAPPLVYNVLAFKAHSAKGYRFIRTNAAMTVAPTPRANMRPGAAIMEAYYNEHPEQRPAQRSGPMVMQEFWRKYPNGLPPLSPVDPLPTPEPIRSELVQAAEPDISDMLMDRDDISR